LLSSVIIIVGGCEEETYEKIHPSAHASIAIKPLSLRSAKRDTQMTKTSGNSSEGKYRAKASGETALAWMYRCTSLVSDRETKITEKEKGTKAANILTDRSKERWREGEYAKERERVMSEREMERERKRARKREEGRRERDRSLRKTGRDVESFVHCR
jgi:hypothetical protein